MEPYVIGIDLGTGSAKAIAMDHTGAVIETVQVSYPTLHPKQNYQEQAPELIWQAFVKCISRITASLKKIPDAISLSSAMHSVIPVDKNGNALMNMIIWADNRSAANATRIHLSSVAQQIYEQSGTPIHAMTPMCKLQWLKENEPDLFRKTSKFISIKEYIWFKLFQVFEVDYSIASATGLMNIEELSWNDPSLGVAGINVTHLSTLVNTNYNRRCTDKSLCKQMGVEEGMPFFIGASDGCLANVGSFATEEGYMALTIGTSGAVRVARKKPMLNFKAMTFNYRLDEHTYISGGPTNNGGVILKWYAENLLGKKLESTQDYTLLFEALERSEPGAQGLIFLPYVLGERAPIWNSDACGVFFGMRGHHQEGHFTRAVIEGISMTMYDIAHNMADTGLSIKQIHVSGGFVQSGQWLQILANLFGKKNCLINIADASAIGAALLAMKNLGLIDDYQSLKPKEVKEFLPQKQYMSAYQELFLRYRNLYEKVAPLMTPGNIIGS
ncbi:MAG: gluconokinase [Cyclobacteriaceae bacterium]